MGAARAAGRERFPPRLTTADNDERDRTCQSGQVRSLAWVEGGTGTTSKVVKFRLRPDPLAR